MKRLLFLLSGNISTTPRALKVLYTALAQGYSVDLCLINRLPKWEELDEKILKGLPCKIIYVPFRKEENYRIWLLSGLIQKGALFVSKFFYGNLKIKAFASSKINYLYHRHFHQIRDNYDIVIGFSGMYYPAWDYANRLGIPFAFDMEDYHPGEVIYHKDKVSETNRREWMFEHILPEAIYVSYASPLIQEKTEALLRQNKVNIPNGMTINNTFRHSDFELSLCHDDKIRFVWFSQMISYGRGIDLILPILHKYKKQVSLTLIGNMDQRFYREVLAPYEDVLLIREAMPQNELHKEIGKYDIGLAIEQDVDENKSICLSNKIFTYLLSGLYVVATSTKAQKQLMSKFPTHGIVVDSLADNMEECVKRIISDIQNIRKEKAIRFSDIANISWEVEEKKILNIWNNILN